MNLCFLGEDNGEMKCLCGCGNYSQTECEYYTIRGEQGNKIRCRWCSNTRSRLVEDVLNILCGCFDARMEALEKGLLNIIDGERSDRANAILEWVRAVSDLREEVFKQIEQERIGT